MTAYQAARAPYGSACKFEMRNCAEGALSGSYAFASCETDPPAPCQSASVYWKGTAYGYTCHATAPGGEHGTNRTVSSVKPPGGGIWYSGSAVFSCNNGAWKFVTETSSCRQMYY